MFEGKRFLPLTGMPIWKMARSSTVFAVWLPEPLTVATWMLKSLTRGFTTSLPGNRLGAPRRGEDPPEGKSSNVRPPTAYDCRSSIQLSHGQALRFFYKKISGVRCHAPFARGGQQELVLAIVRHDVAAGEYTLDRGPHLAIDPYLVALHVDTPTFYGVQVDRRSDVDHQVVGLESKQSRSSLGLGNHRLDRTVFDFQRLDSSIEVPRNLHLVHQVDIALHPCKAVQHLYHGDLGACLVGALGALEARISPSHDHDPLAGDLGAIGHP